MTNSRKKILSSTIPKEELIWLYFDKMMTMDEVGEYYGYYDRQPIMRLFKKFGIVARSKIHSARLIHPIPEKESLMTMMSGMSILACSNKYKISRSTLASWLKHYGIETKYFTNKDVADVIFSDKYQNCSPREIATALDIPIKVVKYYKKSYCRVVYDRESLLNKMALYSYDFTKQSVAETLRSDDMNVYDSIMELTNDHILESDKITERVYRIVNGYASDRVDRCRYCGKMLKFYTYTKGYGNSIFGICIDCNRSINGVSEVSQKLFVELSSMLSDVDKSNCRFAKLNKEYMICVTKEDKKMLEEYTSINKRFYSLDFVFGNKVIEFDGSYYHKDILKEQAKDAFLKHKGFVILHIKEEDYKTNQNGVVNRCLQFLKS